MTSSIGHTGPSPQVDAAVFDLGGVVADFRPDVPRNIEGAIHAGMQAVLFKGIAALEPELKGRGLL